MDDLSNSIAIIGMAGRFPGASDTDQYWLNLRRGHESIRDLTHAEVAQAGITEPMRSNPLFVPRASVLEDIDLFDADYFSMTPREAQLRDPQHRALLQCAELALLDAGYPHERNLGETSVFASVGTSGYLSDHLMTNDNVRKWATPHQMYLANEKDFAPSLISYKLNLQGPAVSINCGCSSSLVAVHLACRNLLAYESDMALAGAASIFSQQKRGYLYTEGGIVSPDGRCRTFSKDAAGTIPGSGAGVIVLKRVQEAIEARDHIYAIIRSSAINNDGNDKVGYTAPSVDRQVQVIAQAQALANVEPTSFGYIEAHGTATSIGDQIEIAALKQVFGTSKMARHHVGIGSVKSNIGHLNAAAGIAGLVKTVLSINHGEIPPSLHCTQSHPDLGIETSPFRVVSELKKWPSDNTPKRAGVSAFGIGGTNAHVVVEQPPMIPEEKSHQEWFLLPFSARTESALNDTSRQIAAYLGHENVEDPSLADMSYTLQERRHASTHRRFLVASSVESVSQELREANAINALSPHESNVVFMFPGQGSQHLHMARGLYRQEPEFRAMVDYCAEYLSDTLKLDLRTLLFDSDASDTDAAALLAQTRITQPALFTIEYALAKFLIKLGVQPQLTVGHSLGEYTAACIGGVFTLDEALELVAARGSLIQSCPPGAMLAVDESEETLSGIISKGCTIATINGPRNCVVSGTHKAIDSLEARLPEHGLSGRRLQTSHAFHSDMMDEILTDFEDLVARFSPSAPTIPFISNTTGTFITDAQATSPGYWSNHLRSTVRFHECVQTLAAIENPFVLEVGPGQVLRSLVARSRCLSKEATVIATMRHARQNQNDHKVFLSAVGSAWQSGADIDWSHLAGVGRTVHLPVAPFSMESHWVEPMHQGGSGASIKREPAGTIWAMSDLVSGSDRFKTATTDGQLVDALHGSLARLVHAAQLGDDTKLVQLINELAGQAVENAFASLGLTRDAVGSEYRSDTLIARFSVIPQHQRQFSHLLKILANRGVLYRRSDADWTLARQPRSVDRSTVFARLEKAYPDLSEELQMYGAFWASIADTLQGKTDPLAMLFPDGDQTSIGSVYKESPEKSIMGQLLADSVSTICESSSVQRPIKILEIGAGTGASTSYILKALAGKNIEYVFTDVSRFFLNNAQETFKQYDFIDYRTLDFNGSMSEQGFACGEFDIVVAVDALHVGKSLRHVIDGLHYLVKPGGYVQFVEGTKSTLASDLTFGFIGGWWDFEDTDVRPDHPLASAEVWLELLGERGFGELSKVSPETLDPPVAFQHALLTARRPLEERVQPKTWVLAGDGDRLGSLVASLLRNRGDRVIELEPGNEFRQIEPNRYSLNLERSEQLDTFVTCLHSEGDFQHVDALINLLPLINSQSVNADQLDVLMGSATEKSRNVWSDLIVREETVCRELFTVVRSCSSTSGGGCVSLLHRQLVQTLQDSSDGSSSMRFLDLGTYSEDEAALIVDELYATDKQRLISYQSAQRMVAVDCTVEPENRGSVQEEGKSQSTAEHRSPVHASLQTIWSDLLGIDDIRDDHNFYEVGGDSLLATQVVSRVSDNFGVRVALADFLEFPTIDSLAVLIERSKNRHSGSETASDESYVTEVGGEIREMGEI